jgi:hypothetical protein
LEVTGYVAFDVPQGARPGRIELHDSAISNGIAVDLLAPARFVVVCVRRR